jgi:hypothetical protein
MLAMPKRRQPRDMERANRIAWERGLNEERLALIAELTSAPAQVISDSTEPPF